MRAEKALISLLVAFAVSIMQALALAQPQRILRGTKVIPMTPDELFFYGRLLHAAINPKLTIEEGVNKMNEPYGPLFRRLNFVDQNGKIVLKDKKNHHRFLLYCKQRQVEEN